jgi:hypothetical protein
MQGWLIVVRRPARFRYERQPNSDEVWIIERQHQDGRPTDGGAANDCRAVKSKVPRKRRPGSTTPLDPRAAERLRDPEETELSDSTVAASGNIHKHAWRDAGPSG